MTDMVTIPRATVQQALEALIESTPNKRNGDDDYKEGGWKQHTAAITALKAALAQQAEPVRLQCVACGTVYADGVPPQVPLAQQAEPVAWIDNSDHPKHRLYRQSAFERRLYGPLRPLYTAPPAAQQAEPVAEVRRLREQRDALLEALKMLLSYALACEGLLNATPAGQIDIARAAIKAAEEQK